MKARLIVLSLLTVSSSAYSAQCKLGPDAYGAGSASGKNPTTEPPSAVAVIPAKCNNAPCDLEIGVPDLLPPPPTDTSWETVSINETNGVEHRVISLVDKAQEKEAAKAASEKALKEADDARKEADRQEKEAAEAQEKADKAAEEASNLAEAEQAAEEAKAAEEAQREADAARKEADKKAAGAQEESPQDSPPPEDDGGGTSTDDNIRPLNDIQDPQGEAEAKKRKDKEAYAQGKGKLDCSNPKVQCVNAEITPMGAEGVLQITVPIVKDGVDCRYSRCDGEMDIEKVDSAKNLLNTVNDICRYSECMSNSDDTYLSGSDEDCSPLGKVRPAISVSAEVNKAILEAIKTGGLTSVKVEKKPTSISNLKKKCDGSPIACSLK